MALKVFPANVSKNQGTSQGEFRAPIFSIYNDSGIVVKMETMQQSLEVCNHSNNYNESSSTTSSQTIAMSPNDLPLISNANVSKVITEKYIFIILYKTKKNKTFIIFF